MPVVDLTLPLPARERRKERFEDPWHETETVRTHAWDVPQGPYRYTAVVHEFDLSSMSATYIDFPGHIAEHDDGRDAATWPVEALYRVDATVLRLDRADGSGAIHADELRARVREPLRAQAVVLNALGARRFDAIRERSVYLAKDAVAWLVDAGMRLFVSDVYESDTDPQNVFGDLFAAGVATVCCAVDLHRLPAERVRLTALPLRAPEVKQLPCRVLAEWP